MKYFAFLILISLPWSLHAQGWYRTYDVTPFGDAGGVVTQTPDGGYLLAGATDTETFDGSLNNIIVIKTDQEGEVQWTKELDHVELGKSYTDSSPQVAVFNDGTYLVAANTFSQFGCQNFMIIWRLDPFGNVISQNLTISMEMSDLIKTSNGGFAVAGFFLYEGGGGWNCERNSGILILDTAANITGEGWASWYHRDHSTYSSICELDNSNLVALGGTSEWSGEEWVGSYYLDQYDTTGFPISSSYLGKISPNGLALGSVVSAGYENVFISEFPSTSVWHLKERVASNGQTIWDKWLSDFSWGIVMTRTNDGGVVMAGLIEDTIIVSKIISKGDIWTQKIPVYYKFPNAGFYSNLQKIIQTTDQGFIISGYHAPAANTEPQSIAELFLLKIDSLGNYGGVLEGHVTIDANNNCISDPGEQPVEGWVVEATGPGGIFYGTSDTQGHYILPLNIGTYNISSHHPGSPYWTVCNDSVQVSILNSIDTVFHNVSVRPKIFCPLMDVDITANLIRRCVSNVYQVSYCNYGTITAPQAQIKIVLNEHMEITEAGLPYSIVNDTIVFSLGDVAAGDCNSFFIKVFIECLAPAQFDHCISAHISPSTYCLPGTPPTGIQFTDEDCRNTVMPVDPNDKTASPEGIGFKHLIPVDTSISYLIRFQNTGNDTAFNVVVLDTMPEQLDLTTFQAGASSHTYTWEVYGESILKFTFPQIMLPDSNVNEISSHGFVSFQVSPKKSLIPGTRINNTVSIYFDFNAPVITAPAFHTIDKPFRYNEIDVSVCQNEYYHNIRITSDTVVMDTLIYTLYDSVITINIDVLLPAKTEMYDTFCEGDIYVLNNSVYDAPGVYEQILEAKNGCDSLIILSLDMLRGGFAELHIDVCRGIPDSITGIIYEVVGEFMHIETFVNHSGCDSTVQINISVHPEEIIITETHVLQGSIYNGFVITKDTQFLSYDTTLFGCPLIRQDLVFVTPSGLENLDNYIQIQVNPNPFKDEILFTIEIPDNMVMSAGVYDAFGKKVAAVWDNAKLAPGSHEVIINGEKWLPGIYFLQLQTEKGGAVRKVIKI